MSLEEWRRKIKRLRSEPGFKVFPTNHVRLRMRERHVSFLDLLQVIERGAVIEDQSEHGETKLRMSGRDVDGRAVDIVVVVNESEPSLRVITVIAD